jgi:hypothetical protein
MYFLRLLVLGLHSVAIARDKSTIFSIGDRAGNPARSQMDAISPKDGSSQNLPPDDN